MCRYSSIFSFSKRRILEAIPWLVTPSPSLDPAPPSFVFVTDLESVTVRPDTRTRTRLFIRRRLGREDIALLFVFHSINGRICETAE